MEAAEAERYQPFFAQLNDWPPMPEGVAAWPRNLYVLETTWPHWQGSATEIARLARRAEEWTCARHTSFQTVPRERWYFPTGILAPQFAVTFSYTVATSVWAGGVKLDWLPAEIEARRSLVRRIVLKATAINRTWLNEAIFDETPLKPIPPPVPLSPGEVRVTTGVPTAPELIQIDFQRTGFPAVCLRTIAPDPEACTRAHDHMRPHIEAGARPQVWDRLKASRLGVGAGAVIGVAVGFIVEAVPGMWVGVLSGYALGSLGDWLVRWAFPPLELVEAWERSRWQIVKTWFWQGLIFLLAVVGIILTVLLSQPSTSAVSTASPHATTHTGQP
jgi:hypothetical protein